MTDEIKTNMEEGGLSKFAEGYIGFNVKAKDSEENRVVHNSFRRFCKERSGNNYTKGIKLLMELSEFDFKYEMLYNEVHRLTIEIEQMKAELMYVAQMKDTKEIPNPNGKTAF
jgi:hypothetical protein